MSNGGYPTLQDPSAGFAQPILSSLGPFSEASHMALRGRPEFRVQEQLEPTTTRQAAPAFVTVPPMVHPKARIESSSGRVGKVELYACFKEGPGKVANRKLYL